MLQQRPYRRLYVHVPFCAGKCDYCAFYSEPEPRPERMSAYIARITAVFRHITPLCANIESVFIGGGTPSALGPARLARLLEAIRGSFTVSPQAEWTCELNPGAAGDPVLDVLAAGGVNRVSVGVQSFSAAQRRTLGRRGDPIAVPELLASLRARGIRRLNLDLIYAIPGQKLASWQRDVRQALDLGIEHLSTYALTTEEGTALARARHAPTSVDMDIAMWEAAETEAENHGLRRYEVSNFARPGCECDHNLGIWRGDTYAGCGPAAASFDGCSRWCQVADLDQWLAGAAPEEDCLSPAARAAEILAFGLRTADGWSLERFRQVTGMDAIACCGPQVAHLVEHGLLELSDRFLRPTPRGFLLNDVVAEELLMDTV